MLMSLTMRLRPNCPPVPWGATSVVAIPAPSFDLGGGRFAQNDPPEFQLQGNRLLYGDGASSARQIARPKPRRNLSGNEKQENGKQQNKSPRTHYSALKNCAMVRNLLYRDTINSAGGIFFSSEKCFCRLTSSKFAA